MIPFYFPARDALPKEGWSTPLRLGSHRQPETAALTKAKTVMHRFLSKMDEMECDFQDLKARINGCIKTQPIENEQENQIKCVLRVKLDKMAANMKFAIPEVLEKLEKARSIFLENQATSVELKEQFLEQIKLLISCYQEGVIFYFCRHQKKPMDLMDYLEILVLTPQGRALLITDHELFFQYGNAYVLAISKKLSLLYPRDEFLENSFSEVIALLSNAHEEALPDNQMIEKLIVKIHTVNDGIQGALAACISMVRANLSRLTKPEKGIFMLQPTLEGTQLFRECELIDDPEIEKTKKTIRNVLQEILETEKTFKNNITRVAETNLFEALVKEGVIGDKEREELQKGWKELVQSSERLISHLTNHSESLLKQLKQFFSAFSSQQIENHMENFNDLVCRFLATDSLIKKIQQNVKGQQMLLGFSASCRVDIVDIWIMPVQRPLRYILLLNQLQKGLEDKVIKESLNERVCYLEKWAQAINLLRP